MKRLAFPAAALAAAILFAGTGFAGQPRRTEPQTDDEISKMTVEELRTYFSYYYAGGGRDPLTMRLPTDTELGMANESGSKKVAVTMEDMEKTLVADLKNITSSLKDRKFADAKKDGDDAINRIDNVWTAIDPRRVDLIQMVETIRSYTRLAASLKANDDIKEEFEKMSIRVEGVIWSPTDAKAMVNGRLLAAGEVMLSENRRGELRIDMIEEHGVVFQFKGMRFRLPVNMYSRPEDVGKIGSI